MKKTVLIPLVTAIILSIIFPINNYPKTKQNQKENNEVQRTPLSYFDLQENTKSNINFLTTNYGIFGNDVIDDKGACKWPRDSQYQFLWGGGFWFGTMRLDSNSILKKFVDMSYIPINRDSYFIPGRIEDGLQADTNEINKYKVYFSTDFNSSDGTPLNTSDDINWPIWNTDNAGQENDRLGNYIIKTNERNFIDNPKGPVFISDEDIFSTYKDTDISFTNDSDMRKEYGYPLGLQVEQMIYSWNTGIQKDFLIKYFNILNLSKDTLYNCWFGYLLDPDIDIPPYNKSSYGRADFYSEGDSLKLGYSWGSISNDYNINRYGYVGITFLMTPSVDDNNFIRKDKSEYNLNEQIGLKTFFHYNIEDELFSYEDMYNLLASAKLDRDNGSGDKRICISSGPFHMLPNDTAKFIVFMGITESDTVFHQIIPDKYQSNFMSIAELAKYAIQFYRNNLFSIIENEPVSINNYLLYPNPANDLINISTENSDIIDKIEMFNLLGEKVFELTDIFSSEYKLNTRNLQSGTYYIRIKSGNNTETKLLQIAK